MLDTRFRMSNDDLSIIALLIGGYGAVLSTLNLLRDRARVSVGFHFDMTASHPEGVVQVRSKTAREKNVPLLTDIHVTNRGKRPATILSVGYRSKRRGFVMIEAVPPFPCTLADGQMLCALIDQRELDF